MKRRDLTTITIWPNSLAISTLLVRNFTIGVGRPNSAVTRPKVPEGSVGTPTCCQISGEKCEDLAFTILQVSIAHLNCRETVSQIWSPSWSSQPTKQLTQPMHININLGGLYNYVLFYKFFGWATIFFNEVPIYYIIIQSYVFNTFKLIFKYIFQFLIRI